MGAGPERPSELNDISKTDGGQSGTDEAAFPESMQDMQRQLRGDSIADGSVGRVDGAVEGGEDRDINISEGEENRKQGTLRRAVKLRRLLYLVPPADDLGYDQRPPN